MDETSEIDGLPFRGVLEDLPLDLLIGWSASLLTYVSKHNRHRFPASIFPKHVSYRFGLTTWNFIVRYITMGHILQRLEHKIWNLFLRRFAGLLKALKTWLLCIKPMQSHRPGRPCCCSGSACFR